ncbi:lantibiotic dehydratase [Streptomyces sp. NPDC055607]
MTGLPARDVPEPSRAGDRADGGEHGAALPETPLFVRLAGLPVSSLEDVRSVRSLALAREILDEEDRLAADGAALCDALHDVIGSLADPTLRSALVGLRRAVHNRRRPGTGESRAVAALPPRTAAGLERWQAALADLTARRACLSEVLDAELLHSRAALLRAARHPHLRRALSATRPELLLRLDPWLRGGRPPSERTLTSLARYVARAAAKTSPLSTFTFSSAASWSTSGPAVTLTPSAPATTRVEVHPSKVMAVARALARRPEFAARVRLRVNPSARTDGMTLTYLASPPDGSLRGLVPPPGILQGLEALRALARAQGSFSRDEALASLTASRATGAGRAERLLDRLVDVGVVEAALPVPDQTDDLLGSLVELTAGVPASDGAGEAVRHLTRVHADLGKWASSTDPAERHDLAGSMEAGLTRAARACGAGPEELPLTGHPAFETAVHTEPAAACSTGAWARVLDDLDVLRRLLGVFDPGLPFRLGVTAYARERFGTGVRVPFLALYGAYYGDLADGSQGVPDGGESLTPGTLEGLRGFRPVTSAFELMERAPCPRLRALPELWRQASALLVPDGADHPARRVDSAEVLALVERWPAFVRPPGSVSVYGQPYLRDGRLRFAVNQVNGGHGRGSGRLNRLIGHTPEAAPSSPGVVRAEIENTLGTSLNLRRRSTAHAIDYPSLVSERPPDRLVPLGELLVDTGTGDEGLRLYWPRRNSTVEPVHTATMSEMLLPPPLRMLVDVFGAPATPLHSTWRWIREIDTSELPDGVRHTPRTELGDLTVQRAYWTAPARGVPRQETGEEPAAFLLRLVRWTRDNGIPDRSFVRLLDVSDPATTSRLMLTKSRKPMYLDTANRFLVRAFLQELQRAGDGPVLVFFQEALPDPREAFGAPRPVVSEFLVEITERSPK